MKGLAIVSAIAATIAVLTAMLTGCTANGSSPENPQYVKCVKDVP